MLPNLSNAALFGILWVKCVSTKVAFVICWGFPFSTSQGGRWKAFPASLSAGLFKFFATSGLTCLLSIRRSRK
jgi:hypothetical protein